MPDGLALRRPLARLGMGLARCRRQRQGDDIDIDAAVEARVDALAGCSPSDGALHREPAAPTGPLGAGAARRLGLGRRAGTAWDDRCTSTSVRPPPSSRPRSTTSATGSRSTPSTPRAGRRCSVMRVKAIRRPTRRPGRPTPRRPRPRRLHAAGCRHPPRRRDPGGAGRDAAATARRALRRLRLRPRLRGPLRRGRRPAGAGRGPPPRGRLPVPQRRRRRRAGRAAPGVRHRGPRLRATGRPTAAAHRPAVPFRAAIGGGPAARVPAHRAHAGSVSRSRGERHDSSAPRPFYVPVGDEEQVFKAAFRQGLSLVLKGPTGCGKTRFVEAMAHDLDRPLITVSCHDDLTTADLVGRYLLEGGETTWVDGPLTRAVREGAICYLDEVVEARQDTTVVIHPLADHRRQLPIDRLGTVLDAAAGLLPGRVVQPRLPERPQGPQGLDPPAHGRHRARLPAAGRRGEDRRPRGRRRRTTSRRSWCSSARRSGASRPPASARWPRPGCLIAAGRLVAEGLPLACGGAGRGRRARSPTIPVVDRRAARD